MSGAMTGCSGSRNVVSVITAGRLSGKTCGFPPVTSWYHMTTPLGLA